MCIVELLVVLVVIKHLCANSVVMITCFYSVIYEIFESPFKRRRHRSFETAYTGSFKSNSLLVWFHITYKAMGYQVLSLTMGHFDIYFLNRTMLDLSVHLTTVFKMSKYMKTCKNTSTNYKKQILFFQKFTEPKISYNIS